MDPAAIGFRLAATAATPLIKKLFVREGPGAGLVDRPVRISGRVSFRGEKRTLTEADLRRLAAALVRRALDASAPGERPLPAGEEQAVADALARTLHALGDLTLTDAQAVALGHQELARTLRRTAGRPERELSADAAYFHERLLDTVCLHILHFFTQRSAFVPRTLVEQTRRQAELTAKVDELLARTPRADGPDPGFEYRYRAHLADKHNRITIYGLDLRDSADIWPLDVAYLSLEATHEAPPAPAGPPGQPEPAAGSVRVRAEDALLDHDRVLLRGDAGSGKTTLVQWLAVTATDRVPFVLPLRTLIRAESLPAPDRFLAAVGCPLTPPDGWAERVLAAGRGLVMADGIDEIPGADRARARDWLLDLVRAFPGNQWLITSRPTAVRPDWLTAGGFRELRLAPMSGAAVTAFVRRWHAAADAAAYEDSLLDSLSTKKDLAQLATNPLMCGLICALHRERRGYLPEGRKELYDAALSMFLTRRDKERGMGRLDGIELGLEAQLELLQRIAYSLVLSGRTELAEESALALVDRSLAAVATAADQGDAPAVFRHLLLRSGLLRQPAMEVVSFAHRTFQDYLGARYAVAEGHLDVLLAHAGDPQWEDVLRMAVAHARPGERAKLLRGLLAEGSPRLALLALACLEHATALDPAVRDEVERRARELIPPRTWDEAEALAQAGPLVLELLPGPDGLTDDEAYGVVAAASLVGREGALGVLKRFRGHASRDVQFQLIDAWGRFDAERYAREVLAHVDGGGSDLRVWSPERFRALRHMPPRPRLDIEGPYRMEEILEVTDPLVTHRLALRENPHVTDLRPLTGLHALNFLSLMHCPAVGDLTPLAELPLDHLTVLDLGALTDLNGLDRIRTLSSLTVGQPVPGTSLSGPLPTDAPLTKLYLRDEATRNCGLNGLSDLPLLQALFLSDAPPPTAGDWAEIAGHPTIATLHLDGPMVCRSPVPLPELPRVTSLFLHKLDGTEDLAPLARALPALSTLTLLLRTDAATPAVPYETLFPSSDITIRHYAYAK